MAKNITLMGANYPNVPAVDLPKTGGGTARFYDINVIDDLNSTSTTDALSANQGRVLNEYIANKPDVGANNVKIRYGVATIAAGQDRIDFYYGITFTNVPTVILTPGNNGNGAVVVVDFDIQKNYCTALVRQGTITYAQEVHWIAIGI